MSIQILSPEATLNQEILNDHDTEFFQTTLYDIVDYLSLENLVFWRKSETLRRLICVLERGPIYLFPAVSKKWLCLRNCFMFWFPLAFEASVEMTACLPFVVFKWNTFLLIKMCFGRIQRERF